MEKAFWLKKWEVKDIAFHEAEVNAGLINHLDDLQLKPGERVLVPLCGKTKDMLWLQEKGFKVTGIELSTIACEEFFSEQNIIPKIIKKDRYTKYQHENIELICGDLFDLTPHDLPPISAIYDCKALIALPPQLRKKYVSHLINCTGPQVKILLLSINSNSSQIKSPPFPIQDEEIASLYGKNFNIKKLYSHTYTDIPERLLKKGYTSLIDNFYLISNL